MTYLETVNWMFSQLPMYQNQGESAYKIDLSNTLKLVKHLKHPEQNFKSVHVAGTNGKGSTSHMLASILQETGLKVGLYTSPHLKDFRERIRINGKTISKQAVIGFIKSNKTFLEQNQLSFFEMTVGLAFTYFSKQKVDIAIIEVGLGGRLDSTNIITPEVSVITNIGLDHTQFLGTTLPEIAKEKAGIIKKSAPVVIGQTQKETKSVFIERAKQQNSELFFADQLITKDFKSDLKGEYQKHNIKTVVQTVSALKSIGYQISQNHIISGLKEVVSNTNFKGRWQILQNNPKVIADTAHNKEGLTYTIKQLLLEDYKNLHIVFGVVNDKDLESIINILPKAATYYFCKPNVKRGFNADLLKSFFNKKGFKGEAYNSVNIAYKVALQEARINDVIYIGGSTFVVAELI